MARVTNAPPNVPAEFVGVIYTDSPSMSGLTLKFEVMSAWNGYGIATHAVQLFLYEYWSCIRSAPFKKVFVRDPRVARNVPGPGRNTAVRLRGLSATFQAGNERAKKVLDKIPNALFSHRGPASETYVITSPMWDNPDDPFVYRAWPHQRFVVTIHRPDPNGEVPDDRDPGLDWEEYTDLLAQSAR